ncbi:hypothetical protein FK178_09045 [Antarcticibacterium arcticum]|uniref:Uncharacterized protein n=1 Tax=Antarcticibacterium arcticum TaxID=2585771 RepID=A0A5B8YIT8_9FLAO|nr:hypothetical protein [Antarcticibacterium arcticum]QED37860.1 hypothetical protein FK178_09045 [Antarcticibacterium arcticum]
METESYHIQTPGVKEIDLALKYMKDGRENLIPQDSFREATLMELEEFGLVEKLPNGNYLITDKGLYAKRIGAFEYIKMKRTEDYFLNSPKIGFNTKNKFIETAFVLFLLLILVILVTF